jgi:hypothetical protein
MDIQNVCELLGTIMTKRQFLTLYLMKCQVYGCRSINNMPQQDHNDDTKSYLIGIDNHASASMTNCKLDFIGTPKLANVPVNGIKEHLLTSKIGYVRWVIQDHKGKPHLFDIPGNYLVPELPIRLFSPQHAAREIYKKDNKPDSMVCTTFADGVSLTWCSGKYKRTVPLRRNNMQIVRVNLGYNNSLNSMATNPWSAQAIKAYKAFIPTEYKLGNRHPHISTPSATDDNMEDQPRLNSCDPEEELLLWHQRLAHMPFKNLQHMLKIKHSPKRLSRIQQPKLHACMHVRESHKSTVESKRTEITHHKCN